MTTLYELRPGANLDDGCIERIVAWARANGLDADAIPEQSAVCVEGDELTVTVAVDSVDAILPGDRVDRIEVRRTVPLVELPPDDLFTSYTLRERIET